MDPDLIALEFPLGPDRYFVTEMTHAQFDDLANRMADYLFRLDDSILIRLRRHWPLLKRNPRAFLRKVKEAVFH